MKRSLPIAVFFGFGMWTAAPAFAQTIDLNSTAGRQIISGARAGARAGAWLHIGDLTGDYWNKELIIGSPDESSGRGSVRIRFGGLNRSGDFTTDQVDAVLTGGAAGDHFGAAADAGHVTRPNLAVVNGSPVNPTSRDLIVGAPDAQGGRGEVYLFPGPFIQSETRTIANAVYRIIGRQGGRLGSLVESADLNGDGYREIIAVEPAYGCVHVFDFHNATGSVLDLASGAATMTICGAGSTMALATGDITGDDIFDLAIGAPGAAAGRGQVYLIRGRSGPLPSTRTLPNDVDGVVTGVDVGDAAGSSLWIADVDDDADPVWDLIIGVPGGDGPGNSRADAGEVYVIWGSTSFAAAPSPNLTLFGAAAGHRAGARVTAGDITLDGPHDVVILAPGANSNVGEVYAYFGRHRFAFPKTGQVDLAAGSDRRVIGDRSAGPIVTLRIWEATARGAEEVVVGVPSASTVAGAAAGRLYAAISPQLDVPTTTFNPTVMQCQGWSAEIEVANPSVIAVPWTFYTETPWLRSSLAAGTTVRDNPGRFRLVAVTAGLAPGTYSGNATILSRGRELNAQAVVWVHLTVTTGAPSARSAAVDFTGDGCADTAVFQPKMGTWHVPGRPDVRLGTIGDLPMAGDYDGDRIADAAVYRRSNGTWYFNGSEVKFGEAGDIPVPADYDGDGRTDIAVYRPSLGRWLIRGQASVDWGGNGDLPVPADYDGDGRADFAVYARGSGMWRIRGQMTVQWGTAFDLPVPGDYNGDGRADIAVYRRSGRTWFVKDQFSILWGDPQTFPIAMDVNRDGRSDLVSYHRRTGTWDILDPATGAATATAWGSPGDIPAMPGWQLLVANSSTKDFDADGSVDLVWQNDASRQAVAWYMGGTDGNIMQRWKYLTSFDVSGWTIAATADFNSDGTPDLVWQNDSTRRAVVWYMGGPDGSVMQSWNWLTATDAPSWRIVAASDFNGDGQPDLLWQNDSTRQACIWFMSGPQGNRWDNWTWLASSNVPNWRIVGVSDVNDDGRTDVVWQHDATRQVSVWYLAGSQGNVFQGWAWLNPNTVSGWHVVGTHDIDGDAKPDLVWQNDSSRAVSVWFMGGIHATVMERWAWMTTIDVTGWKTIVR